MSTICNFSRVKILMNQGKEVLSLGMRQDETPLVFSVGLVPKPTPGRLIVPRVYQGSTVAQAVNLDVNKQDRLNPAQCINGWRPSECIFDWSARTYICTTDLVQCDDRPIEDPIDPGIDQQYPPADLLQRDVRAEPMGK